MNTPCCERMGADLNHRCDVHLERSDCPDAFIKKVRGGYGLMVHDGGSSVVEIAFCPWCGSKLSHSPTKIVATDWSNISTNFQYDGALRDIYILNTSVHDWAQVWDFLRATPEWLTFYVEGKIAPPPNNIAEVFHLSVTQGVLASVRLGKQTLNCRFFQEDEIEFDLDPTDVDGPVEAARLIDFIKILGRATQKEVLLTSENAYDEVIARYDPGRDALVWSTEC